jgi:hypothetical protein
MRSAEGAMFFVQAARSVDVYLDSTRDLAPDLE